MRIKFANIIAAGLFCLLGLGIFNLSIIQGKKFQTLSDKNCIRLIKQDGSRGKILDRNEEAIVDSRISYNVMVSPSDPEGVERSLSTIAKVLGVNIKELKKKFKESLISSSLPVMVAKNIEVSKAIALEELKSDNPTIIIQPQPLRHYSFNELACHLIGYVNEIDRWRLTKLADYGYKTKDIVGFGGVEEKYDYSLRQEEGGLSVEVDHRGRITRTLGFKPPVNGKDIQLTIDIKMQKISENALGGRKGCVILMEPFSGEILAMASAPAFNPDIFVERNNAAISRVIKGSDAPLLNRAISGVYPPASVFKMVLASAGLETKKISPATTFVCTGSTPIGGRRYNCWDTHGPMDLDKAITHSCDIYFYRIGLLLGAEAIHDYALKFGFSKPTGLALLYESSGFIPSPWWRKVNKFKNWYDGDTANFSIGQGETMVTPLQVTRMLAVFANGGKLVTPFVIKAIDSKDVTAYQRKIASIGLKPTTINHVSKGLRNVVLNPGGTANILTTLPVSLAGKTGTAQVPKGATHAWFAGFFPYKNPKFVVCVFLEHGGPGYAAAVTTKQIIEEMHKEGLVKE